VRNAVDLGFRYVETDVRASRDGEAFAFHDTTFARLAPTWELAEQPFAALTAAQIRSVELPGGARVATIAELLEAFPSVRFNIDVKRTAAIAPTVRAVRDAGAEDRVLLASFSHRRLQIMRRALPGVATSASPREIASLRWGRGPARRIASRAGAACLQVPTTWRGRQIVTPGLIAAAHRQRMQVHVWTVDDPAEMTALLDDGVDGLITDRPDVLRDVLVERHQWRTG
jgi:glycerophosphoryl diester phosphodiesterase